MNSTLDQNHIRLFFEHRLAGQSIQFRDQISARCPFHDDKHASLSINMLEGVWNCHAGCGQGGLIDFEMKANGCDPEEAKTNIAKIVGADAFGTGHRPEAIYQYRDAQGRLVFEKLRYPGKKFVQRRPGARGYEYNLDGIEKPLYNLPELLTANEIFFCEGEKDADRAAAEVRRLDVGDARVAVTTNFGGASQWDDKDNVYFAGKKVVIFPDNDDPGQRHAERIATGINPLAAGVKIVKLPGLRERGDVSDYLTTHTFTELIDEATRAPLWSPSTTIPTWRSALKSYGELEKGEFEFLIDKFLPHGITFLAGLSGVGKTWFGLSIVKALATGNSFLHNFAVPHAVPVIYLIPESGERAFRTRLEAIRLTNIDGDRFLCRTMGSGPVLGLNSPEITDAVRALKPVLVLDTAIRFSTAQDENSAAQNRELANGMFGLLSAGAKGIIAIHHSPKSSANSEDVKLENSLRGSGDLGAMADTVYHLRCEDPRKLRILVQCVKPREFEPPPPFHIEGRPYISNTGDFALMDEPTDEEKLARALAIDSGATVVELARDTGIGKNRISTVAAKIGWRKNGKLWVQERNVVQ